MGACSVRHEPASWFKPERQQAGVLHINLIDSNEFCMKILRRDNFNRFPGAEPCRFGQGDCDVAAPGVAPARDFFPRNT
jgi:hypothetical protein